MSKQSNIELNQEVILNQLTLISKSLSRDTLKKDFQEFKQSSVHFEEATETQMERLQLQLQEIHDSLGAIMANQRAVDKLLTTSKFISISNKIYKEIGELKIRIQSLDKNQSIILKKNQEDISATINRVFFPLVLYVILTSIIISGIYICNGLGFI